MQNTEYEFEAPKIPFESEYLHYIYVAAVCQSNAWGGMMQSQKGSCLKIYQAGRKPDVTPIYKLV